MTAVFPLDYFQFCHLRRSDDVRDTFFHSRAADELVRLVNQREVPQPHNAEL
jgi:hypothetical protein